MGIRIEIVDSHNFVRSYPGQDDKLIAAGKDAIRELKFAHLCKDRMDKLVEGVGVRIDMQHRTSNGQQNIHVQIDDKRRQRRPAGGTTIANVLIDGLIRDLAGTIPTDQCNVLLDGVKKAMANSLDTGRVFLVHLSRM